MRPLADMIPSRSVLAALVAIVMLALSACGGAATSPAGSPTPVASGIVPVTAKEFSFDPATLSVPAGEVTFAVRNGGTIEHQFELYTGDTLVDGVKGIGSGVTKELTVTLDPGEYTYVCKLSGHEAAGMKGTLTVTGG